MSDGRAGTQAQAVGLADAVARRRPAEVVVKRIGWKGLLGRLPWRLIPWPRLLLRAGSGIAPPWPDVWIAAGRATLPLSVRLRRWSGGRTFVVQTQDPRTDAGRFDLVIPPRHDGLAGDNVLPITGSPNRLTPQKLAAGLERFADTLDPLPRPRVAVLIGGRSKGFDLPPERAMGMAREIEHLVQSTGGSLMMTFSRRTPALGRDILLERLRPLPGTIWSGEGDNPYFAYLAAADVILVTEDSTNLATDAAATGKPVFVLRMAGGSRKFSRFHQELEALGVTRPFAGVYETWSYPPLAETDRAAAEILRRYDARP